MADLGEIRKRGRDDEPDSTLAGPSDSPEVKRLREDLFDGLDDEGGPYESSSDLDSFMKSFEDEITASPLADGVGALDVLGLASPCAESTPDLGYLLEASDDELGLPPPPPTTSVVGGRADFERVDSESSDLGSAFWDCPSNHSLGFGFADSETDYVAVDAEYAALDGLFDCWDLCLGSAEFAHKPETMPAQ